MTSRPDAAAWPELSYPAWKDACSTLQLWTQIVGKVRLSLTPWLNHSWHVALNVTARGLGTPPIGYRGARSHHRVRFHRPCAVAAHERRPFPPAHAAADDGGGILRRCAGGACASSASTCASTRCRTRFRAPCRFPEDRAHAAYDRDFAERFWRVLLRSHEVFSHFRTGFLGKASPVHFFWGSFDLAVTRFSGRHGAAASGRRAEPAGRGGARGLFARGVERGLLAGRRGNRLSGVLFLRLSGAGGFCRGAREAGRGVLVEGTRRIHPAV